MRRGLLVLVLLTVACNQGGQSAVRNGTPSQAASSARTGDTGPSDLPLSSVSFSCRLPIAQGPSTSMAGAFYPSESAFMAFPSTAVTIDPTGNGGGYFDRAFSRWLPVGRNAVAPDGKHYAYTSLSDQGIFYVHVVDVAGGGDRAIQATSNASGISFPPVVVDYASEGIYLSEAFEHPLGGLWLLDPTTGSIRSISTVRDGVSVMVGAGGGIFWASEINRADPNPVNTESSRGILPNQIDRLDLNTGSLTPWLYMPGSGLSVAGIDLQGRPLIAAEPAGDDYAAAELLIAIDATSHRLIQKGEVVYRRFGNGIADSHGVWFGNDAGIYLYSDALGLQKVSDHSGSPANGCF
jgi:hypothetical protein